MESHVKVLGILYIIFSIIGIFIGVLLFFILVGSGFISGDSEAMFITSTVGIVLGGFFTVISIPGIFAGLGLLKFKEWGRILAIILGVLNLINFPFGTALGAYTLWALLNQETIKLFQ